MRKIGLHLRWHESPLEVAQQALALQLPIMQCFLVSQRTGRHAALSAAKCRQFLALRDKAGLEVAVLHGSYRINLADARQTHYLLDREIVWAERLGFTHMVLHPGAVPTGVERPQALAQLARLFNALCSSSKALSFVLENVAFGGKAVGGDLDDFMHLRSMVDFPEKLFFCIDTAHAFSYGYNLVDPQAREAFIKLIEETIGSSQIAMIHCNDTSVACGARLDNHAMLGQGSIGCDALYHMIQHPLLCKVPLILELPEGNLVEQENALGLVRSWHK